MRRALVIGIGAYQVAPLTNPVRDATRMRHVLESRGFETRLLVDKGFDDLNLELDRFESACTDSDFSVIYVAAHGMEVNGEGFVQPIDFPFPFQPRLLRHRGLPISGLLGAFGQSAGPKVLVLDICRVPCENFDFDEWRAVTEALRDVAVAGLPRSNTLVGYSTGPGESALDGKGENSLYCEFLSAQMSKHHLEVEDCFKEAGRAVAEETSGRQRPVYSSTINETVRFSHLPLFEFETSLQIPLSETGAIFGLHGVSTSKNAYVSDGSSRVWEVNPRSFRAAGRYPPGSIVRKRSPAIRQAALGQQRRDVAFGGDVLPFPVRHFAGARVVLVAVRFDPSGIRAGPVWLL